jgi:hypothetical protein
MGGRARASNPQLRNPIGLSPLVAKSAPRTPSRWRHGFEPRWDYQGKRLTTNSSSAGYPPSAALQHFRERLRGDTEGLSPTAGAPGGLEQLAGAQGGLASEVRLPPS